MNFLLPGVLLISFAPILVKQVTLNVDLMGAYRMLLGMLFFTVMMQFYRGAALSSRHRWLAMAGGVAFALDMICWHRAIHLIGPGLATLLANLQVLLVAGSAYLLGGPRPRKRFWLAALLALSGLWLLAVAGGNAKGILPGLGLGCLAAVGYTLYLLILKGVPQDNLATTSRVMFWVCVAASVVMGALALVQGPFSLPVRPADSLMVLAYGLLVQGVAWFCIARAMQQMRAFRVSLILLLQPVMALVWEVLFLGRVMLPLELVGVMITLSAIVLGFLSSAPREAPPAATPLEAA